MRQTALFLFLLIILSAGSAKAEDIVGKWEGKSRQGVTISYEFKADNTVMWQIHRPKSPKPISARYSIDYSTDPAELDIFDFDYPAMAGVRLLAIVEFISPTKIKIDAVQSAPSSKDTRPTRFSKETVEFDKVE